MDRGAWLAPVHGVTKESKQLTLSLSFHCWCSLSNSSMWSKGGRGGPRPYKLHLQKRAGWTQPTGLWWAPL